MSVNVPIQGILAEITTARTSRFPLFKFRSARRTCYECGFTCKWCWLVLTTAEELDWPTDITRSSAVKVLPGPMLSATRPTWPTTSQGRLALSPELFCRTPASLLHWTVAPQQLKNMTDSHPRYHTSALWTRSSNLSSRSSTVCVSEVRHPKGEKDL